MLLSLAAGVALSATVALAGTAREAEATFPGTNARIAFASDRTTGTGVDNPTGDREIFTIKPDGTGLKQITHNTTDDISPVFSPDGQQIAYRSIGIQDSNPEGDREIYRMSAEGSGSGHTNLTNNGADVDDRYPSYSPGGAKIVYDSVGKQTSNSQADYEVYSMNAADGSGKKNLSNNGSGVYDEFPDWGRRCRHNAATAAGHSTGQRSRARPAADRRQQRGGPG